jgi:hypothetical protein
LCFSVEDVKRGIDQGVEFTLGAMAFSVLLMTSPVHVLAADLETTTGKVEVSANGNTKVSSATETGLPLSQLEQAFFEKQVRPLLIEHCYKCHSEGKKIKGGLSLDSKAAWSKGGDAGPAIVPGKPDESLLIEAIRYQDEDLQMPPKQRLPAKDVAV